MDTRKRGFRSLPSKGQEYTTKKEVAERKSFPMCPHVPTKMTRMRFSQKSLFPERTKARAVFFSKPVTLSRLYNSEKEQGYFDQIFATNGTTGEGSFGLVYKAKSREDEKYYAIKQLKSPHHLLYGYAEVKNCEKIGDHLNCVQFYMAWEEERIVHFQMEYCQLSLAQYAILAQTVPEPQLWEIMYDMLSALSFLHEKNLIHLDIKPSNIMMSNGVYKLADFGLLVDLNKHDGRKISTISDGDAKYLACEVLEGVYSYSCDIFGLGISILEVATNLELPEFGPLWHQIRKDNLPSMFYDGVTPHLAGIIEKMMEFSHWDRPTAPKILSSPGLRQVHKQDLKFERTNYSLPFVDDALAMNSNTNNNNNIIETPRRPLYEVRNSLNNSREVSREVDSSSSTDCKELNSERRGLSRVKLAF